MAWIESHQELGRHPKTVHFAKLLGVSRPTAVGHLHYLWWWAMDYAQDGNLARYPVEVIAEAVLWEGEANDLWQALIIAGFVNEDGTVHDWFDYAGSLIEKRVANRDRMRMKRAETVQRTCVERAAHVQGLPYPTLQDPTLQDPTIPPSGSTRGMRLPDDWTPPETSVEQEALKAGVKVNIEIDKFNDYWHSQPGQKGIKTDWLATWRNWLRKATEDRIRLNAPRGVKREDRDLSQMKEDNSKMLDDLMKQGKVKLDP